MAKKDKSTLLEIFPLCIFYSGGGTDIQSILRFSHLTDTLISPTLSDFYNDIAGYEKVFKEKCRHLNNYYGFDMLTFKGSERMSAEGVLPLFRDNFPPVFSNSDIGDYHNGFAPKADHLVSTEAVRFTFTRKISPQIERNISRIWLKAEAISSLDSLYRLSGKWPRIILTIQTGVMEEPQGLFARYLQSKSVTTRVWVRGYWDYQIQGKKEAHFNPENCLPPFVHPVQKYPYWYSSMGQPGRMNEECGEHMSRVVAYASDVSDIPAVISFGHPRKRTTILQKDINLADPEEYDLIITREGIWNSEGKMNKKRPANLLFWEELFRFRSGHPYHPLTTFESLQKIQWLRRLSKFVKIAITPMGYEDEAVLYKKFKWNGEIALDVYHLDPLDFIELKARDYFNQV